jgi:hypothetical protein
MDPGKIPSATATRHETIGSGLQQKYLKISLVTHLVRERMLIAKQLHMENGLAQASMEKSRHQDDICRFEIK